MRPPAWNVTQSSLMRHGRQVAPGSYPQHLRHLSTLLGMLSTFPHHVDCPKSDRAVAFIDHRGYSALMADRIEELKLALEYRASAAMREGRVLAQRIEALRQELQKLERERLEAEIRAQVAKHLLEDLVSGDLKAPMGPVVRSEKQESPVEAVDRLVRENPGVYSRRGIMDALEGRTTSEAANERAVISTAVGRRVESGDFFRDPDGRVWPADHPDIQEQRALEIEDD